MNAEDFHDYLRRLPEGFYHGHAVVHWSMSLKSRATGWLDRPFHQHFRELLLHACHREMIYCPGYCLMPDHVHLMWMGMDEGSRQKPALAHLRRNFNLALPQDMELQKQPFDHVLRRHERERGAFQKVATYIMDNPVRAGLVASRPEWPFTGAMIPGYPELSPAMPDYWERFWRLVHSVWRKE